MTGTGAVMPLAVISSTRSVRTTSPSAAMLRSRNDRSPAELEPFDRCRFDHIVVRHKPIFVLSM